MLDVTLDLSEDNLSAFQVLIWFLYCGSYSHFEEDGESGILGGLRFSLPAKVYALATKYQIHGLRHLAIRHLRKAIKDSWDSVLFVECISIVYGCESGRDKILQELIIKAIHESPWTVSWRMSKLKNYSENYVKSFPSLRQMFTKRPTVYRKRVRRSKK